MNVRAASAVGTCGLPPLPRHLRHMGCCAESGTQPACAAQSVVAVAQHTIHYAAQSMELQRLGIENIPGQESARVVHLNPPEGAVKRTYSSNAVHTAKCVFAC